MKYSKQRALIENAVLGNRIHPTADDIYSMLKPNNPNLSLGTVYRNLNNLAETGKIKKLNIPNGISRFDGELTDHYHMFCESCGGVYDVESALIDDKCIESFIELEKTVTENMEFVVTSHQIFINGVCKGCRNEL